MAALEVGAEHRPTQLRIAAPDPLRTFVTVTLISVTDVY